MTKESIGGKKYFVKFTDDDYSCCCSVYFMKQKTEMLEKFKEFKTATAIVQKESESYKVIMMVNIIIS